MIEYVAGFLVDEIQNNVVMIRKRTDGIYGGHWNGVGGKVELNETYAEAQSREFHEEAGIWIKPDSWNPICRLCINDEVEVRFFISRQSKERLDACFSVTDEHIEIISIEDVLEGKITAVHNIPWILLMGLTDLQPNQYTVSMTVD